MLVIRLARTGRKGQASYRLVVADKKRTPTGKFVARLGHYNPHSKELVVDKELLAKYFGYGAQPSSTVVKLLKRNKIAMPKWAEANLLEKHREPKKKAEATEGAAAASAPAAPEAEAATAAPAEPTEAAVEPAAKEAPAEPEAKADAVEAPETEAAESEAPVKEVTKSDEPAPAAEPPAEAAEAESKPAAPEAEASTDDVKS